MYAIIGINEPQKISNETIIKKAAKFGVDTTLLCIADTGHFNYLKSVVKDPEELKLLYQPTQLKIFDVEDSLVSFTANCIAGGFPNLQWNRNNYFDTLPARIVKIKHHPFLTDELLRLRKYTNEPILYYAMEGSDYYVIVLWTVFMKRQSKRLIKLAKQLPLKHRDKRFRIIYVNNESWFTK